MKRRDETPNKTYLAVPAAQGMAAYVFGFLQEGTFYFNVDGGSAKALMCNNGGVIITNSGPTLTDDLSAYLVNAISNARYVVEFVDVWSDNTYQVGDQVEDWQSYALIE